MLSQLKIMILCFLSLNLNAAEDNSLPGLIEQKKVDAITCGGDLSVKDHMQTMSILIYELSSLVEDVIQGDGVVLRPIIIEKTQLLRVHLGAVLNLRPEKLKKIDPQSLRQSQLIFQSYITAVIIKTIEIEKELLEIEADPMSQQHEKVKVASLIVNLKELIDSAHSAFRD